MIAFRTTAFYNKFIFAWKGDSRMKKLFAALTLLFALCQCAPAVPTVNEIENKYRACVPSAWGEAITGVLRRVSVTEKIVFLTFDACGGARGSGADTRIIELLRREKIPATLFINSRWIDANPKLFADLARDPLFSIQNHGFTHHPLSVTGRSVYGIAGTASPREVYEEIMGCDAKIAALTGKHPRFFRSGTAYYDDVAVKIASDLGYTIAGFDVLGDRGATYSADEIETAAQNIRPGSIVIYHMNQPKKATFDGVSRVIPKLKAQGWRFARPEEFL